jgi:kinesin family protein 6/9
MESPKIHVDSWAIATYLRVKPTFQAKHKDIEYHIQGKISAFVLHRNPRSHCARSLFLADIKLADGNQRSTIDLVIPPDADPGLVHNNSATGKLRYEFDHVFDSETTQEEIFDMVAKEKIHGVLEGFSCTVFAYGQTGSGKTYTIFGGDSFAERGLIPRSLGSLFSELKVKKMKIPSFSFKCQVSFTEIYKETVYDLLEPNRTSLVREEWTPVQLLEGVNGLVLKNLSVYDVESEEEALQLFFMGNNSRLTTATAMNAVSSRSHAVFTVVLESEGIKADQTVFTSSKINLVDLAGSERMYKVRVL